MRDRCPRAADRKAVARRNARSNGLPTVTGRVGVVMACAVLVLTAAPAAAGDESTAIAAAFGIEDVAVRCRNLTTGQVASGAARLPSTRCDELGLLADPGDRIAILLRGNLPASGGAFVPPLFVYHPVSLDESHFGLGVGDLDGDGDQDIVQQSDWRWWENDGRPRPTFTIHPLPGFSGFGDPQLVDLDGNGTTDVVVEGPAVSEALYWHSNQGGSPPAFDNVLVDTREDYVFAGPMIWDVQGDGELEILCRVGHTVPPFSAKLDWFERDGESFTPHTIITALGIGGNALFDFDQDGDGDVVAIVAKSVNDISLRLFINDGGDPPGWLEHLIEDDRDVDDILVADFDLDGDQDFSLGTRGNDDRLDIYENVGAPEPFFVSHQVAISDGGVHTAVGNVDHDGFPDVVSSRQFNNFAETAWYRNLGTQPPSFEEYAVSIERLTSQLEIGDLDGDGDLDLVGDSLVDAPIFWFEQRQVFGGAISGLSSMRVACRNVSTAQTVQRNLQSRFSWDCQEMGLQVAPGEEVLTTVVGELD